MVTERASPPLGMDELPFGVEDRGLSLIDVPQGFLGVQLLGVHAAQDFGRVAGGADAAFPVACVQALACVGEIPDHGAVIISGRSCGQLDDESDGGGYLGARTARLGGLRGRGIQPSGSYGVTGLFVPAVQARCPGELVIYLPWACDVPAVYLRSTWAGDVEDYKARRSVLGLGRGASDALLLREGGSVSLSGRG